jgi:hypothetical protein
MGLQRIKKLHFLIAVILMHLHFFSGAQAQRGEGQTSRVNRNSPLSNSPGFFDSYVARKSGFTADLFGALDFGINDSLTLGANSYSILSWLSPMPLMFLKMRGLLYSKGSFDSALTLYSVFPVKNSDLKVQSYTASSMNSFFIGSNQALHLGIGYASIGYELNKLSDIEYQSVKIQSTFLSFQYEFWFSDWFDLTVLASTFAFPSLQAESSGAIATARFVSARSVPVLLRLQPSICSENWIFGLPIFSVYSGASTQASLFFNITYISN